MGKAVFDLSAIEEGGGERLVDLKHEGGVESDEAALVCIVDNFVEMYKV
jgi:hypothetical protein